MFECPYCYISRVTRFGLSDHIRNTHTEVDAHTRRRVCATALMLGPVDTASPTTAERLDAAGADLTYLANKVADIEQRMASLNAPSQAQIRRQALNDVLDGLVELGEYTAIKYVRSLMKTEGS